MTHRSSQLGRGRRGTPGRPLGVGLGGSGAGSEDTDGGKILSLEEIKTPSGLGAAPERRSGLENIVKNHHLTAKCPSMVDRYTTHGPGESYSAMKWSEALTLVQRGWTLET